ncbi:MAG: hypothetical protein ACNS62_17215 [Candidatus Cyclobacteriaceae bacterium M3_2C_046]
METVEATFKISFTNDQYNDAVEYIEDMKKHPRRVYWIGKEGKSDEELIYAHIVHRILSGFYNNSSPSYGSRYILDLKNSR